MKTKNQIIRWTALVALLTFNLQSSTAFAQGTAFTYQGRLNDTNQPANGSYDLTFGLFNASSGGGQVGNTFTNSATAVSNGLFTVTLDFGAGVFTGSNRWLEIAVRTNGAASFTKLTPRQPMLPVPYAIMANSASNLLGTLPVGQLGAGTANISISGNAVTATTATTATSANSATTATTANNFSGSLAGDVTGTQGATTVGKIQGTPVTTAGLASGKVLRYDGLNWSPATDVISLTGNSDITVSAASGNVTLGDTATSASTASTIVKRDASGNFSAGSLTLSGNLNLPDSTATNGNIYTGGGLLLAHNGVGNFFAGPGAGNLTMSGIYNTAIGSSALQSNTNGSENTAIGVYALLLNRISSFNTAIGSSALYYNTNAENTAIGAEALHNNTSGSGNTAIGSSALTANVTGWNNTACGNQSLWLNTNGGWNTAMGVTALRDNTSGTFNTAIGNQALYSNTSGSNNIALGASAGVFLTNGSYNIYIGHLGNSAEHNVIRIGQSQTNTYISGIYNSTVSGTAVQVNSSGQLGVASSSRKFKQDIHSMADKSDELLALRPVTFKYKPEIEPQGLPQFGLIAEEVEQVDPNLVVHDQEHGIYTVRYEAVNAMLLNEFLKEHRKVGQLESRLEKLEQVLETRNGGGK